ncbi:BNR repeat-containing protein [Stieleria sp. TO1_6]|nr:BNR repeat-containing protein [Stieleria tagensis]
MLMVWLVLVLASVGTAFGQDADLSGQRVPGYKGIWFTLGQFYGKGSVQQAYLPASREPVFPYGDKYSGGLGTYTAKHTPLAIYSEQADKTFFVYGGTTNAKERHLLCMISYYDHRTHQVPQPVVVHDKQTVNDPHDNPSLAIDKDGFLWVFVSGRARARPGFKYRSTQPWSIDSFELITTEEMTYPQPHYNRDRGFLHLFTKYTGVRELYWEQSKDGIEWSKDQKLAGIREAGDNRGGHYQTSASHGDVVGTFFNRHPNGNVDQRTDLYYLQTSDQGRTWTTVDGQPLTIPLTEVESPARVIDYASKRRNVYLKDMGFDNDGNPVLLYVTSAGHEPGPPNDPREFCLTRWDGLAWQTSTLCATDHNYDMGSLYLQPAHWRVLVPSAAGPQPYHGGGEMVLWHSEDQGATWSVERPVTQSSPRNHNYARRPLRAKDPFYAFWADGDPTELSESRLYFSDSDGKRVWQLPGTMQQPFAEPTLVVPRER